VSTNLSNAILQSRLLLNILLAVMRLLLSIESNDIKEFSDPKIEEMVPFALVIV
jgi:hypothetical protein